MSRPDVLAYARGCHTDLRGLLESAYYKRFEQRIPVGALDAAVALFEAKDELPDYMEGFMYCRVPASPNSPPMTGAD